MTDCHAIVYPTVLRFKELFRLFCVSKRKRPFMPQKNTAQNINWKKIFIWAGSVIAVLLLLLFIGGVILQNKLPETLKNRIYSSSDRLYRIEFADMDVSLLAGSVDIEQVHLIPDTAVYNAIEGPEAPATLIDLKSSKIRLSGINVLKLIFGSNLNASSLTVDQPEIVLMDMLDTVRVDTAEKKAIYSRLPEFLKGARMGVVRINELSYVQQQKGDSTLRGGQWTGLTFAFESVALDSLSHQDSSRFWFCKDIQIDSRKVNFMSADGMYDLNMAAVKASAKTGELSVTDFKVIPKYPEIEFSRRLGKQGDRYNFVFAKIAANGIDFKSLESTGKLKVSGLSLEDAELRIFNNKTLPPGGGIATKNFPHLALKRLDLPVVVDSLLLKNLAVYYKELNPDSGKPGTVFFTQLYGSITNISNDSAQWKADPWAKSAFKTNFMGKVPLNVSIDFLLPDKDGAFHYSGTLGGSDARLFNQLLEPLALARVESGKIQKLTFSVKANRFGSTANVQMLYSDLKVNLLKKDGAVLKKKGFLSFLANTFVVKNSNPRKDGEAPLRANVIYEHAQDRSFFNLMWKSIFTGIKDNLGIPDL